MDFALSREKSLNFWTKVARKVLTNWRETRKLKILHSLKLITKSTVSGNDYAFRATDMLKKEKKTTAKNVFLG